MTRTLVLAAIVAAPLAVPSGPALARSALPLYSSTDRDEQSVVIEARRRTTAKKRRGRGKLGSPASKPRICECEGCKAPPCPEDSKLSSPSSRPAAKGRKRIFIPSWSTSGDAD